MSERECGLSLDSGRELARKPLVPHQRQEFPTVVSASEIRHPMRWAPGDIKPPTRRRGAQVTGDGEALPIGARYLEHQFGLGDLSARDARSWASSSSSCRRLASRRDIFRQRLQRSLRSIPWVLHSSTRDCHQAISASSAVRSDSGTSGTAGGSGTGRVANVLRLTRAIVKG